MNHSNQTRDLQSLVAEIIDEFTGLVGFAELLQGDCAKHTDHAEEVLLCAERALELVRTLSDRLSIDPPPEHRCNPAEVVLDLQPSLRRVVGPSMPLEVRIDPDLHTIPLTRRELEALVLHLVAFSRDAYGMPGRVRVRSTRVTDANGASLIQIAVEDEAGPPRVGDSRWFLLSNSPTDLLNALTPFVERVRDAGGSVRIETSPDSPTTTVCVEFPIDDGYVRASGTHPDRSRCVDARPR